MNNFKIPKIRFMNFNDKWNYKTLDEISNSIEYGINAPAKDFDGNHKYLRITDIDDASRLFITEKLSSPDINFTAGGYENYKLQKNDLLFARTGASVGKTYLYRKTDGKVYYAGFLIRARLHDSYDGNFVFQQTLTDKYKRFIEITSQRSGQPGVNGKEYGEWKIGMTSYDEQTSIGSFFRTLDDLLASYKDNLTNYQSLKATMLSKIFPKTGQTVPEIRLDGFEGEWEVVNLGTLIENYDEIISGASGFPIATSSRKGLYLQNDYFEGGRTGIDLTLDFHRVPMGYVTYRHMSDDSIFKFNKNNFETDVLVSKEYPVFISNDSSDIDFLLYHLNNSRLFLRFSTMQKLGGTRVRLYYKNFITYKLAVPTLKEQQAIGAYFSNLDNLIAAHQEKISQLETLKKKLLQEMFI
ncbi:restriction endonuclease subunit S [Streptococcus oralis]|uniref:Type I restriction modification DNA specificity domain protein n=1 Tax=Streptococcus oralis SK610 TaxID=1095741 RepID=I0Q0Q2_STROR|nr:restriction endonuclease subunit S [Streptococcus oralis]EIC74854.1 type I restriction modification DNA specificity domain protein [Streptococcus oralis SK610]